MKTLFLIDKKMSLFGKTNLNTLLGLCLSLLVFSSCEQVNTDDLKIQAKGEKPEWRTELTAEMKDVI